VVQQSQRLRLTAARRWRLAALALLLACAAAPGAATPPQPSLHPNLADALAGGFQLLVGRAPFTARLWVQDAAGYQARWQLAGAETSITPDGQGVLARFTQPGVYYPAVQLSGGEGPEVTLQQRIVVLGESPGPSSPGKYGVNEDLAWDFPSQTRPEVRLMQAAGVQWLRLPIRWSWVEPHAGAYTWTADDPVVDQAAGAGLKLLAVLGSTPSWASGMTQNQMPPGVHADAFAPRRTSDFARYVYETVQHYQGRVAAYELLNEPNTLNHWRPQPDAARFIELLCAGYYAAKYSDPSSVVVAGGLNGNGLYLGWEPPDGRDFLKAIYAGPGALCFDVMAIHPYAHPIQNGLAELQRWVDETRAYMRAQGDDRELWVTEIGWGSGLSVWGNPVISEAQQAAWVRTVYGGLAGPQKVFWYNFKDGTDPAMTNPEYHWGWLHDDLTPKSAYGAFQALAK
jgi:hypothetical protein